ncbi:MAG: aldehyde ferredoxin oxidoreductase [Candidatus Rokubacteria bacterium GWC2_70_16]|nr:MAG: aldehyde ferredoxin oxidoreductase [Candidatus Rokubacteria bacterium GWC2_70_16]OGL20855.1 MAG: aldehyde ferredoxin oxidoreductase [Candidatus Rokubacteria bacterium RIFCSPLOWO2_12_FULL_71_19]
MNLGGFRNRVARVDLTRGKVSYEPLDQDDVGKYVGGRGLGAKYVFDNGPTVDPLSPRNILVFMTGPLSGTDVNLSGRIAVSTKSPLTGTIVDSHHGGWSGARLKWAGLDGLIFSGKAAAPKYAVVSGGTVKLYGAAALWGKGTHDTVQALQKKYPGKDVSIMLIGPAGEKKVRFACVMNEMDRASGRGGTGAVMGSKNLKAIVVLGKHADRPRPADREAFKAAHAKALEELSDERVVTAPRKGGLSVYGTNVLMNIANAIGAMPTRNATETFFPQHQAISGEMVKDTVLVSNPTCHACPVACKKEVKVNSKYNLQMESVEYESAWALGANCGLGELNAVVALIDRCNDYGIDTIEAGNALSVAMEATARGYLGGKGLAWGDAEAMLTLLGNIAHRRGLGRDLAEGPARAAAKWGHPEISMSVKGMSIPAYDPRGIKGMGIAYATSNRGACHLRGYTPAAEVVGNVLGPAEVADPLKWEGKGKLTVVFQNVHAMTDCLDVCKFATFAESLDTFAKQYSAVTGNPMDVAGLLAIGERVYNLERHYNNLAGFREGSDSLPERFLKEPSKGPGSTGQVCELQPMLADYYAERGWVNGVVPEKKLKELQIT